MSDFSGKTVHSVDKAIELLDVLLHNRTPMSLQALTASVGYPKSTVHALLTTLRAHDMITQQEDGRYALGIRLFEYGSVVSENWNIARIAHPYLEQLSSSIVSSTFLSVLDSDSVISIDSCVGGDGLQVVPETGRRLPLHATSQGKLFLSSLSASDAEKRLQRAGMPLYTPHTISDFEALSVELSKIKSNGYAIENGEYKIGLRSASAPVFGRDGHIKYALGFLGFFRHVQSEEFQSALSLLLQQADLLSQTIRTHGIL